MRCLSEFSVWIWNSDSHWAAEFRRQRTDRLEQSATSTTFAGSVAEHLQVDTEDASLLICPATLSRFKRDFAAAYKSADLLTYLTKSWNIGDLLMCMRNMKIARLRCLRLYNQLGEWSTISGYIWIYCLFVHHWFLSDIQLICSTKLKLI